MYIYVKLCCSWHSTFDDVLTYHKCNYMYNNFCKKANWGIYLHRFVIFQVRSTLTWCCISCAVTVCWRASVSAARVSPTGWSTRSSSRGACLNDVTSWQWAVPASKLIAFCAVYNCIWSSITMAQCISLLNFRTCTQLSGTYMQLRGSTKLTNLLRRQSKPRSGRSCLCLILCQRFVQDENNYMDMYGHVSTSTSIA